MNNPKTILSIVCAYYGIEEDVLFSKLRNGEVVVARRMYIYMLWKLLGYTHESISEIVNRNISSVTHSLKKMESERRIYKSVENDIEILKEKINEQLHQKNVVVSEINLLQMTINHTNSFLR